MKKIIVLIIFSLITMPALIARSKHVLVNKYTPILGQSDLETINENMFKKNTSILHFYTSAPNAFKNNWKTLETLGDYKHRGIPPSGIKLERALSDNFGFFAGGVFTGGKANWKILDSTTSTTYEKGFTYNCASAYIGLATHLYTNTNFDSYLSANAGYSFSKFEAYSFEINNKTLISPQNINPIFYYANFGMRYLFTSHWGVFADGGIGTISFLNTGFIYKLGK
jgi:hypothetical protein